MFLFALFALLPYLKLEFCLSSLQQKLWWSHDTRQNEFKKSDIFVHKNKRVKPGNNFITGKSSIANMCQRTVCLRFFGSIKIIV